MEGRLFRLTGKEERNFKEEEKRKSTEKKTRLVERKVAEVEGRIIREGMRRERLLGIPGERALQSFAGWVVMEASKPGRRKNLETPETA